MIIPYGHDRTISRLPWTTISIIAICTLVQLYSTLTVHPTELDPIPAASPIARFGYLTGSGASWRMFTAAFVHDGWFHLVGNMLFLWLVGSAVEDRFGPLRFLALYLVGDLASTYAFELAYDGRPTLLVGASGAISACMGGFLVYFARTQIMLWYFLMYRSGTFYVPAYVALPAWLADQLLTSWWLGATSGVSNVAYAAHVGGFVFGLGVMLVAKAIWKDRPEGDGDDDEPRPSVEPTTLERRDRALEDKYQACMDAAARRDATTVRLQASRVILDLARKRDHQRIVALYRAIAGSLSKIPLTDGAFAAAATAAESLGELEEARAIRAMLSQEHPGSRLVRG